MDNPWADPWDDSKKAPPAPAWDPPSTTPTPEPLPSWEPQESVSWTAPAAQPETQSWGGEDSWTLPHSTLNGGSINAPIALPSEDDEEARSTPDAPSSPVGAIPESSLAVPIPIATPPRALTPLNEPQDLDADGFGGFETGLDSATEDDAGWLPESDPFTETKTGGQDVWGNSWGGPASEEDQSVQPDEWEAARLQKEEQDKHVPPELLDHILTQFEQLSADIWKDDPSNSSANDVSHRKYDPQSMNLHSCRERIVPEQLTLSLPVPYSQTFSYKGLVEAMKLTRHTLMTRKGPMAMYMTSKGSTSWEASVRAQSDSSQVDVAPPGWKIVPRTESPAPEQSQKRVSGGILSFFTRKTSSGIETPQRIASPAKSIASSHKLENNSPRPSIDGLPPLSTSSIPPANPTPLVAVASTSSTTVHTQSPSRSLFSPTTPKESDILPTDEPQEAPAPSTMSRFLSRFTRSSRSSVSSQHESLSLSADDLEFLSDVVPTSKEDVREDTQLQALSNMIKSPPLPTTLPSPLAPPPRSSQPRPPLANRTTPANVAAPADEDPFSIFDTPALAGKPVNPDKQLQPLPSIPTFSSAPSLSASTPPSVASLGSSSISSTSFTDFFTSPAPSLPGSSSVPPPIPPPKLADTFVFPGPPKSSTPMPTPLSSTSTPGFLPPPPPPANRSRTPTTLQNSVVSRGSLPNSRSSTPSSFIAPPSQPTIDEDDEFSDFITSPTTSNRPSQVPSITTFTPANPASSSAAAPHGNRLFDDFDDFFTPKPKPPPSTTQPLPVKSHTPSSSVSLPHSRSSSPSSKASPRVSRAQHQKTLSLLETVATRGDKWLSPPSPLPLALPPPDASGKPASTNDADLLGSSADSEGRVAGGSGGSMQAQQTQAMTFLAPPPASTSIRPQQAPPQSFGWNFAPPPPPAVKVGVAQPQPQPQTALAPALPPPPPSNGFSSGFGFGAPTLPSHKPTPTSTISVSPSVPVMVPKSSTTTTAASKGGLSAQDLAFFEGL